GNQCSTCREGEISPHHHRNDAELANKSRIPRTDPGTSENPTTRRGCQSACRKSTQRLP
ncbi:hypothetical protein NDU88_007013, partial [Pleurodeles waltl]